MSDTTLVSLMSSIPWVGGLIVFGLTALLVVVHLFFALGVLQDAETRLAAGQKVFFVKPWVWGGAALFGSVVVVTVYWMMHHCALLNTPRTTTPST